MNFGGSSEFRQPPMDLGSGPSSLMLRRKFSRAGRLQARLHTNNGLPTKHKNDPKQRDSQRCNFDLSLSRAWRDSRALFWRSVESENLCNHECTRIHMNKIGVDWWFKHSAGGFPHHFFFWFPPAGAPSALIRLARAGSVAIVMFAVMPGFKSA